MNLKRKLNINFLSSMPRAGNTLLGSLINQSDYVRVTPNSVVVEMIHRILCIKDTYMYNHFPDYEALLNSAKNAFYFYYDHYNCEYVLDRGDWGKPGNLQYLKDLGVERKFIILYRSIFECLASTLKAMNVYDEQTCDDLMSKELNIGNFIWSIENIIKSNENYIMVTYDQLVQNPQQTIDNIFDFIGAPKFKVKTENFDQFSINNIHYNDDDYSWHTIKTEKIEKNNYDYTSILPKNIIEKYKEEHESFEKLKCN